MVVCFEIATTLLSDAHMHLYMYLNAFKRSIRSKMHKGKIKSINKNSNLGSKSFISLNQIQTWPSKAFTSLSELYLPID